MSSGEQSIEVCHVGAPIIRALSKRIADVKQGARVCQLLTDKLRELKGAGLAAPQIGLPYRVFVIEIQKTELFPDREESPLYTVINPIIEFIGGDEANEYEGCFSVPGYVGLVPRHWKLRMQWTDMHGEAHDEVFEGYLARVIQHEFDHLNGTVYLDRMEDMKTLITREHYLRAKMEERCMTLPRVQDTSSEIDPERN